MPTTTTKQIIGSLVAVVAIGGSLAACSSSTSGSSNGSSQPSDCATPGSAQTPAPVTTDGITVSGPLNQAPTIKVAKNAAKPAELVSQDVAVGCGEEATSASTVTVNYAGVLVPEGTEFDASWTRGEPATFPLSGVIQCWQEGVVGMKAGGRRLLVCPSDTAYGSQGSPPTIPPNASLAFVVDLNAATAPTPQ